MKNLWRIHVSSARRSLCSLTACGHPAGEETEWAIWQAWRELMGTSIFLLECSRTDFPTPRRSKAAIQPASNTVRIQCHRCQPRSQHPFSQASLETDRLGSHKKTSRNRFNGSSWSRPVGCSRWGRWECSLVSDPDKEYCFCGDTQLQGLVAQCRIDNSPHSVFPLHRAGQRGPGEGNSLRLGKG